MLIFPYLALPPLDSPQKGFSPPLLLPLESKLLRSIRTLVSFPLKGPTNMSPER